MSYSVACVVATLWGHWVQREMSVTNKSASLSSSLLCGLLSQQAMHWILRRWPRIILPVPGREITRFPAGSVAPG